MIAFPFKFLKLKEIVKFSFPEIILEYRMKDKSSALCDLAYLLSVGVIIRLYHNMNCLSLTVNEMATFDNKKNRY